MIIVDKVYNMQKSWEVLPIVKKKLAKDGDMCLDDKKEQL